jgi:ABC-2 type transport system permease protein
MTAPALTTPDVALPAAGFAHQVRATVVVWQREMIRFSRDRGRIFSSFMQPVLFLFVLGTGLSSLMTTDTGGLDFRTFLFPGVLSMSVLFTAAFSGISMVWDREFGFLREMMVAPIGTTAILLGKCLGGATVATLQSVVILLLGGLVGVPYSIVMMLQVLGLLFLMSFLITGMAIALAARIRQIQSAMPMVQLIITPMMFLSGALFPLSNLPGWLAVAIRVNPMTYAVEPVRSVVFDHLDISAEARAVLDPGITWGAWHVPVWFQVLLVIVMSIAVLALAVARFARTE